MTERKENSGLIDLDALLAQADAAAPAAAPPPERAAAPVAKAEDSLGAVTMELPSAPKQPDLGRVPDVAPAHEPLPSRPARPTMPATPVSKKRAPSAAPPMHKKRKAAMVALGVAIVASIATVTVTRRAPLAPVTAAPVIATATMTAIVPPSAPATIAPAHEAAALDPNALPAVAASPTAAAIARAIGTTTKKTAAPEPASTVALGEIATTPTDTNGDLGSAMRSAVGDKETKAAKTEDTAAGASGQVRPSQGAVVGAIASVLPQARACLGPDDAVRSALVVFRSDGTVKAVEIRGAKSEDACVKTELSKARVAPFADDSFATRVTVRPEG